MNFIDREEFVRELESVGHTKQEIINYFLTLIAYLIETEKDKPAKLFLLSYTQGRFGYLLQDLIEWAFTELKNHN